MKTRNGRLVPTLLLAGGLLAAQATPSAAHNSVGAAIAAGILGLAVGSALSDGRDPRIYGPPAGVGYAAPAPFSPQYNITCYPAQRACYDSRGLYSAGWTYRTFSE